MLLFYLFVVNCLKYFLRRALLLFKNTDLQENKPLNCYRFKFSFLTLVEIFSNGCYD